MTRADAVVVGGGPGGSTCAWALRNAGWNVIVLDRARFPRDKVCAGWLTPPVFKLLDLTPDEYRSTGFTLQEMTGFRTSVIGALPVETRYQAVVSYGIRRCEFDHFLLRRAKATVYEETAVTGIQRAGDRWVVNDSIETPVVIGAGGHFCPVARFLSEQEIDAAPVIAKEAEFRIDPADSRGIGDTPELFFCRDLEGYGWCVRKGEYLNVGLGRRAKDGFAQHLKEFVTFLEAQGLMPRRDDIKWHGHAYLAAGAGPRPLVGDGMLLVGDSAGLAYPESGEGIRPAIESGLLAARVLVTANGNYSRDGLAYYAQALQQLHPRARPGAAGLRNATVALGRALLRSRVFTRRIVLDRWFLRRTAA